MQRAPDGSGQHVMDQRALPRPADARDAGQGTQRNSGVDVLQVMDGGVADLDPPGTARQPPAIVRTLGEPGALARGTCR